MFQLLTQVYLQIEILPGASCLLLLNPCMNPFNSLTHEYLYCLKPQAVTVSPPMLQWKIPRSVAEFPREFSTVAPPAHSVLKVKVSNTINRSRSLSI